jgi:CcmD family protein
MDNLAVYSVVLNGAPYVIAAYALFWVALVGFVAFTFRRVTRLEQELAVVEDSLARRSGKTEA